jgi:hypothetical protein
VEGNAGFVVQNRRVRGPFAVYVHGFTIHFAGHQNIAALLGGQSRFLQIAGRFCGFIQEIGLRQGRR